MLYIGLFLVVISAILSLSSDSNSEKVISEFCKMECRQDIKRKYKFCC